MHGHISLSSYIIAQMFQFLGHKATLYFVCENTISTLATQILHKIAASYLCSYIACAQGLLMQSFLKAML